MTCLWAYVAGVLTLINPCVLPLLPIVIAAAFQNSRLGPLALAAGLTVSFRGARSLGDRVRPSPEHRRRLGQPRRGDGDDGVRRRAARPPRAQTVLATLAAPLASRANTANRRAREGGNRRPVRGGGPARGGVVAVRRSDARAAPSASPRAARASVRPRSRCSPSASACPALLLALAYGSRQAVSARRERLAAWMPWAKPVMGTTLLVVGVAILFHVDRAIEGWLLDQMPVWLQDLSVSV